MSDVWLAEDEVLERPVALKPLAPHADPVRFEREARAAAALSDPNVARIYAYGEEQGRPYMAFEYLPGGSLEDRLVYGEALPVGETASVAAQLASGLAHAHAHGLVHRDLKPANVLFDPEGRAKIADFGIARIADADTVTEAGTVLGTAGYISPEQADGEPATPASDVYSFGVILFRLLTGRLPFEGDSALEVVAMHRDREAPSIQSLRPDAPPLLTAVTEAAMAKDPRRRPPDGAALLRLLDHEDGDTAEPTVVLPRPPRRAPDRRRRLAALAVGALLLVAGGVTAGVLTHGGSGSTPTTPHTRARRPPTTSRAATTVAQPTTAPTTTTTPATTRTEPTTTTSAPTTTAPPTATEPPTVTTPTVTTPTVTTPTVTLPVPP
jgi:eukaryotic-like serine/threonine-protein kinase